MKILLVDDEAAALRRLVRMLAAHSDAEIVGEARDGLAALRLIDTLAPEVLFLDIQMPELDGFGVVHALSTSTRMPLVIFATSFDRPALDRFEAHAIAYLLKPVEAARLDTALARVRFLLASENDRAQEQERVRAVAGRGKRLQRIVGCKGDKVLLLDPEEILWFLLEDCVVKARTATGSYWVNYQLTQLVAGLDPEVFCQTRRDAIVNLHRVKSITRYDYSSFVLTMTDATDAKLLVSEQQAIQLRYRLPRI